MKRQESRTFVDISQVPRQLLQNNDNQVIGEKRFDVGCVYEVDHLNLPTRAPVQLKSIRVLKVTEKIELNVSLRCRSIGSFCNYLSHSKMSSSVHPATNELFVMLTNLARKLPRRKISAQEFDDNIHLKGFWLIKNSPEPAGQRGIFDEQTTTPLMSQIKKLDHESDEGNINENDEDNKGVKKEREGTDEDEKKAVQRKRYSLRQNTRKTRKVKRETESYRKTRWNECQKMIVATFNRLSAERNIEEIVSKEELQEVRIEMDEHITMKMQEEILSFQVQSSAPLKPDFNSALVKVGKQLTDISESIMGIKTRTLSSMVDLGSKRRDRCAEKERNWAAIERCQAVAVLEKCVSTGEKTAAAENDAKLQKLISGLKICEPQGTFIWPNMGACYGSFLVVVQVEDLFVVHTPPSVSSSTASAPPQLPYHHQHPPTSPIRPVPERCAATVTVRTPRSNDNHDYSSTPVIAFPRGKNNTSLSNLIDIPDTDGAFITTAAKRHESSLRAQRSCGGAPRRKQKPGTATPASPKKEWENKDLSIPIEGVIQLKTDILKKYDLLNTPIADQMGFQICGPLSICTNIGLMLAIQTGHNRVLAAQEMINWMRYFEPYYLYNKNRPVVVSKKNGNSSQALCILDGFRYVMECGIHLNANYPLVGCFKKNFPMNAGSYEAMRSSFITGQPRERYSIEGYEHLTVGDKIEEDDRIINQVIEVLDQDVLVNGLIWASEAFLKMRGDVVFDQELDPIFDEDSGMKPNHIVLIIGHGIYKHQRIYEIQNTHTDKWANDGRAYVFARQIREYAFIRGKVLCTGAIPPQRVVVFYTSEHSKKLAMAFAKESNERYAIVSEDNVRYANVIFIPSELDDYATIDKEFRTKLEHESLALFLMDFQPDEKEEQPDHLDSFYKFIGKRRRKRVKWLNNLQYAVFALHEVAAKKTDSGLSRLGAKRLIEMPALGVKLPEWQEMFWMELDKLPGVKKGDASRAQEDRYPTS